MLDLARRGHPLPHRLRWLPSPVGEEFIPGEAGHLDEQVHPIEERPGQALAVGHHLVGPAPAGAERVAEVPAWAGVHRPDEHERRRERDRRPGADDRDPALLQRLPQRLQHLAIELRQLIQEQDPVVGERDLAGTGDPVATSHHPRVGHGVMGGPERAPAEERPPGGQKAGHGVDARHLQRFVEGERGEDPR